MSMFSDMLFEEYEMLDEGKQADEYRERKANEKEDKVFDDYRKANNRRDNKAPYNKDHDAYRAEKHRNAIADKDYKEKYGHEYNDDIMSKDPSTRKKAYDKMEKVSRDAYYKAAASGGHKSYVNDKQIQDFVEKDKEKNPTKRGDPSNTTRRLNAIDAYDRHKRRQAKKSPKTESVIMLIEAYECDYNY